MDGRNDAAAREKGAEDGQDEGEDHQAHVPDLEHVLLLLNHHGMEIRGRREPGHDGGVLDRVPGPVAAPAQDLVRPTPAEQVAQRQKEPRGQRPAARRADPLVAQLAGRQRRQGERERHAGADVAQIQRRRMDRHPVVLQERVEVGALAGHKRQALERRRDEAQQAEEEDRDGHQRGGDVWHQHGVPAAVLVQHQRGEQAVDQRPEQQGSLLTAPERGDGVPQRQARAGVGGDVFDVEVARHQRMEQGDRGDSHAAAHGIGCAGATGDPVGTPGVGAPQVDGQRIDGQPARERESQSTELRHGGRAPRQRQAGGARREKIPLSFPGTAGRLRARISMGNSS